MSAFHFRTLPEINPRGAAERERERGREREREPPHLTTKSEEGDSGAIGEKMKAIWSYSDASERARSLGG